MKRIERRLRALEERLLPLTLPAFIVGMQGPPTDLKPGERVVIDYKDGGFVTWRYRVTTDPDDHGRQEPVAGGYIYQCLRRQAAGDFSWPLPWEDRPAAVKKDARPQWGNRPIVWGPP